MLIKKCCFLVRTIITVITVVLILVMTVLFLVLGENILLYRFIYIVIGTTMTMLWIVLMHLTRFRIKEGDLYIIARPFFIIGVIGVVWALWILISEGINVIPVQYLLGTYFFGGNIVYTYYLESMYLEERVKKI